VNSNFFYLTGFEEEHAVLIYRPGKNPETTVFVHPKDPLMETWEGFLFGENEAKKVFGFDEAYSIKDFEQKAAELIAEVDTVIYRAGLNKAQDDEVFSILNTVLRKKGRKGHPFQNLKDPDQYIAPLRVVKTEEEVELMKKASEISALAHIEVMKAIKPGLSEGYLEGVFLSEIRKSGAKSEAYNSIAASGDNATTLHYVFNDEDCKDGELFLIDAGAEYKYYAGDITRTYPVGQDFTKTQRDLYERILEVQKDLIAMVKPGMTFQKLNRTCEEKLTQIMIDFDLLSGTVEENISNKNSKKYYPHGVGHFLGIDVHDVGYYEKNNEPVPFEAGMCLTIEPGIYVPKKDTDAPESLRGVGIRIEDDILVTDSGNEVMTSAVPKEIDEILKLRSL
jgi:Xaa-Pro aminopeptidase